ncbi:S1 family peptidase, partial [Dehalococcoidia bacterium]|nr:S1 family peptidase [Dehalococcoidia bacterium]
MGTPDEDVIPYVRTTTFWTAPVTGTRDPNPPEWSGKFGRTTGRTSGRILAVGIDVEGLRNQVRTNIHAYRGDSGSPLFIDGPAGGVAVTGILWGGRNYCPDRGVFLY